MKRLLSFLYEFFHSIGHYQAINKPLIYEFFEALMLNFLGCQVDDLNELFGVLFLRQYCAVSVNFNLGEG